MEKVEKRKTGYLQSEAVSCFQARHIERAISGFQRREEMVGRRAGVTTKEERGV